MFAATIINGMKPYSIGRTLGIGLRIAGRIAGQHAAAGGRPAAQPTATSAAQNRANGQVAGQVTRGVARGVGGFLRPFGRIGGILWLEVTGVFFLLFAVVFASFLWKFRAHYAQGTGHRDFLASAVGLTVFFYLSLSSFWRARKK